MNVQRYLLTATLTIAAALAACGGESPPPAATDNEAAAPPPQTAASDESAATEPASTEADAEPAAAPPAPPPPAPPPPPATRDPVPTATPAPAPSSTPAGTSGSAGTTRTAQASSGPGSGELKFNNFCRTCHSVREGDHRLGPSLHGVVGRKAGSAEGFASYSQAMKSAGFVWDEARLDQFLANTESVVRGNAMKPFVGITEAETRAAIIEYLKEKGAAPP